MGQSPEAKPPHRAPGMICMPRSYDPPGTSLAAVAMLVDYALGKCYHQHLGCIPPNSQLSIFAKTRPMGLSLPLAMASTTKYGYVVTTLCVLRVWDRAQAELFRLQEPNTTLCNTGMANQSRSVMHPSCV
jgi:hypothetical protein